MAPDVVDSVILNRQSNNDSDTDTPATSPNPPPSELSNGCKSTIDTSVGNDKLSNGVHNRKKLHNNNNNCYNGNENGVTGGAGDDDHNVVHPHKNNVNNNNKICDTDSCDNSKQINGKLKLSALKTATDFKPNIRWPDLIVQIFLHAGAVYGFVFQFYKIKLFTFIWCK